MELTAKRLRGQLNFFKPVTVNCSLSTIRKGQEQLGKLMGFSCKRQVVIQEQAFENFTGAWVLPYDERRDGIVLYLHGGGYTCGRSDYAKGFASVLAEHYGVRVFCPVYRLAPEHPFPAALDDCLEALRYLYREGYSRVTLCGESAGGGLCYALCLRLKELGEAMPVSIVAISPWVDLHGTGESYEINKENDPTLSRELLAFYAGCYSKDLSNPLVSPLLGELTGMPPSLIFAGGDEILLDDAKRLHQNLKQAGCKSQLVVKPQRWHGYLLFMLKEDRDDMDTLSQHFDKYLSAQRKLRWLRLDNAAKIYPAAARRNWTNFFRMSATLTEPVDVEILHSALDVTIRRFPSMGVRLKRGMFWYYLEQIRTAPPIEREYDHPLTHIPFKKLKNCAFRVIAYENRIAVELFHSLTDGTGAMIFLKSLVAEYLTQRYHISIPATDGVCSRLEMPKEEELEDSFLKYAGSVAASRRENTAYHLTGTPEPDGFLNLTNLELSSPQVLEKAHNYGITVTEYLCAVMVQAIVNLQRERIPNPKRRKPVRVLVPVNLRRLFPSKSMRNFALYVTPEVDTRLGDYSFEEICQVVHHRMRLEVNPHIMSARIATNVKDELKLVLKITPLFLKNIVMKAVFEAVGERKSCLSMSNVGVVKVPKEMEDYITRFDFIIGPQSRAPHNCGILTYGDTVYINFIRNTQEPDLERHFCAVLKQQGLGVKVASNRRK